MSAVVSSVILNSALGSLVYAMRDDDDDETYAEKYMSSFLSKVLEGVNPLTYIPFVKDIYSMVQGFTVKRTDLSVISDLIKYEQNFEKAISEDGDILNASIDLASQCVMLLGIPTKNIVREVRAFINLYGTVVGGEKATKAGLKYALREGLTEGSVIAKKIMGESPTNKEQLYNAIMSGDKAHTARVSGRYADQKKLDTAISDALKENDPRITQAAEARIKGDTATYTKIAKDIINDGFSQDNVVRAINAVVSKLSKEGTEETATAKSKALYTADDLIASIGKGDSAMSNAIKTEILRVAVENGKTQEEAEKSFKSSVSSALKEAYEYGDVTDSQTKKALVDFCGKTEEEADERVRYWNFKNSNPDINITEDQLNNYYKPIESLGYSIADAGIQADTYADYLAQRATCKGADNDGDGKTDSGSVKAEVMIIINNLPISYEQKDALYYLNGWAASKIYEAPWH